MRPRQRLRSTASQATVSSSVLLETPSFVASSGSSRRNASEQLASQLPRTPDDEIALSDTSRRASAASFTAYTDQSQSEPEQPQSPGKRKREGSIGRSTLLGSSPSKRRSWMPGTQADATFHPLTSQGESFAEDTPSEHSGGITSGVPPPEPEPVARLRSEENSRSVTKKRSWFGRPREESQENISSQLETGEPTPAPSLPSLQSTQNTEPNNAPRNADRQVPKVAIEEETSPQGWLTWLGLSRAHTDIIQEDPQSPTTTLPSVPETLPAAVPTSSLNPNSSANAQPEPSHVAEQMSPKPSSSWFSWTRWQNAQPTEALDQPTVPHVEPNHGEPTSEEPSKAVPHQSKLTPVDSRTPGWFGSWKRVAPQVEPTSLPQSDNSIEPSHLEPHPIEAEQPRNPIVDKVPPSTWASYFSSRYASPQRRVGEAHPENMEVDFPAELSTPESKSTTSQQTKQPRPGSSSLKPTPSATAKRIGRSGSQSSFFGGGNSKPPSIKSEDGPEPPQSRPSKPLTHTSPTPPPIASTSASVKNDRQTTKIKTPPMPHLVLPSFEDTFDYLPRSAAPASKSLAASAARKVGSAIWGENPVHKSLRKAKDKVPHMDRLPRKLAVLGAPPHARLRHTKKVVILTTHGWFAGNLMRTLFGEPTGTSTKFATMQKKALVDYLTQNSHPLRDEDITVIPLEGEGKVDERVDKLATSLTSRSDWLAALAEADAIFLTTHSQGSIVLTQLLARLIDQGKVEGRKCSLLCLAAISQGPLASLNGSLSSSVYFNYLENAAARELFEFQASTSVRSERYRNAMTSCLTNNVRVLLCASLSDQVVPLHSAIYSSYSHPNLQRCVFIDGQSFRAVDFMSNLVCFALRVRNAGLSDHGLIMQLSEALAGALSGSGHSVLYEDPQPYLQSIRSFFESDIPEPFRDIAMDPTYERHDGRSSINPYELPWALCSVVEDHQVKHLFRSEIEELRRQFDTWRPTSKRLQDVKYRLSAFTQASLAKL